MEKKEVVLNTLNGDWQSTTQIKNQTKLNWYIVYTELIKLEMEKIVDKMETARSIFWRKK